jgi:diguanylate cyclase (GGDEF)-like protein
MDAVTAPDALLQPLRLVAGAQTAALDRLLADNGLRIAKGSGAVNCALWLVDAREDADVAIAALVRVAAEPLPFRPVTLVLLGAIQRGAGLADFVAAGADYHLRAPFDDADFAAMLALCRRQLGRQWTVRPAPQAEDAARINDPVTGVLDRAAANALVAGRCQQADDGLPVVLVQVDQLARINDSVGTQAGDDILRQIGARLDRFGRAEFGPDSRVTRLSGTRFLLVPPVHMTATALEAELRAIHADLSAPLALDPAGRISVKLGIATVRPDDVIDDVLRSAVSRLSRPAAALDGTHVRAALTGDEIITLFQPQYDAESGQMVGAEALVRWQHPEHGLLGAASLVTAARTAKMEGAVTDHVIRTVLDHMAGWTGAMALLRIAVNVTAADLAARDFADRLVAMVADREIDTARLTIELTESAMMADPAAAITQLAALRAAGFRTAIDDFGTGYSSLALLQQLPLDYLKIDSGLSREIGGSERDRIVVRAVIDLALALGLDVVAEGVESEAQLASLVDQGCRYYQGFLRSPAVSAERLAELL